MNYTVLRPHWGISCSFGFRRPLSLWERGKRFAQIHDFAIRVEVYEAVLILVLIVAIISSVVKVDFFLGKT